MTASEIRARITKATEKIEKKQGTIAKKTARIEKLTAQVEKTTDEREAWSINYDIKYLGEDIKRLEKEITETRKTLEKYEKQLAGELEKEELFTRVMPKEFTVLRDHFVENWDEHDKKMKEHYRAKYEELGYKEWWQRFNGANYALMNSTDEQIHKSNMKDAESIIVDLYNRVKEITGQVTGWDVRLDTGNGGFLILTGRVEGKEGRARVESIEAGGYNIQRLHIRTLVHSI